MKIFVFGNPEFEEDNLPLKILPLLKKKFPEIDFEIKDPNEEWGSEENNTVIDTVLGITDVAIFKNLSEFKKAPRFGMHYFGALSNILHLQKIGKIKKTVVIGLPKALPEKEALEKFHKFSTTIHFKKMRGTAHTRVIRADQFFKVNWS